MHLSSLTCDEIEAALDDPCNQSARQVAAIDMIRRNARCVIGHDAERQVQAVSDWVKGDGYGSDYELIARLTCHRPTVEMASRLGVDPRRLALCADALDGVAIVDLVDLMTDGRQVAVTPAGDGHRVMVPLSDDVYYDGFRILLRRPMPATILIATIGRRACDVVSHPALATAGVIVSHGEPVSDFEVLELETPELTTWDEMKTTCDGRRPEGEEDSVLRGQAMSA